jgi:hypothetical protein
MMGWQRHEQRLDRLVADARAGRPPELDVEALRGRLLTEFRAAAGSGALAPLGARPRARFRPALTGAWLGVAAACVLAIGVVRQLAQAPAGLGEQQAARTTASSPTSSPGSTPSGTRDGAFLSAGELLSAGATPLRVEHAAQATWVLAPGSEGRLLSATGGVLRVELTRGTLDASVLPSGRAESFVVQAGRTEVSVHGTRFQVTFEGELAGVSVSEGEVHVRPLGQYSSGQSGGTPLRAGMQAEFVDGVVQSAEARSRPMHAATGGVASSRSSQTPGARTELEARRASDVARAPAEDSRGAEETPSAQAPAELLDAAFEVVSERIQSCFRQHTRGRGELRIEASTRLGLWVQPNGLILEVGMDPPLAPPVEQCVATELSGLNLGVSPGGYRVDREIRLSR